MNEKGRKETENEREKYQWNEVGTRKEQQK